LRQRRDRLRGRVVAVGVAPMRGHEDVRIDRDQGRLS
jgi:hypothetical protein